MASVQQGEKQLFEKFWRGTFKAVATPRPESIIVASITARKPLPSGTLSCLPYPAEDRRPEKLSGRAVKEASTTNGCVKGKERPDHARRRSRRSPSYSPSPVKKKKKKSSKKRKRNRYFSFEHVIIKEEKTQISQSGSSADLFTKTDSPPGNLASQNGEYHEYDSGNDTSSPPSTQTSSSRSKDSQEKRSLVHDGFGHAFSSGKPKLANSDNSSDSGNSFTSCFSQTKGTALENLSPDAQGQDRRDREREHKYGSSEKESHRERDRRRRRSYSPLRKRRRDSPSHLEARRITSARKRPIPYYRPSPSSSSSASSSSSWYSSFSRSPSRSRSYSSYRTSRSRSWSSSSAEGRSRSRSSGPRSSRSRSRSYDSGGSSDSLRR
ncbi:serine/arginine repetitive matrix protein 4 [Grus japonensis]|uniref:Serine/arginine repetitive matrix protein 4 n=1 Tax=Grus japonensis TaxID=30415 RepID=A0ABC9XIE2_GRUJA